jgi:hypothetical protein
VTGGRYGPRVPGRAERGRGPAAVETALIVVGLAVLFAVAPHQVEGDDGTRLADVEALIHHGQLTRSPYSLVGPLLSSPFLLLGEVVGSPSWWAARFNLVVVSVALLALARLARGRVDPRLLRTFVLVLLFASLLTEGTRTYGPETPTAALVALGLLAVVRGVRPWAGWAAVVAGVANTPAALGALALVAGARALRTRCLRSLAPVAAAVLLVLGEAWLRRGSPLTTGYEGNHGVATVMPYSGRPEFSYPFLLGVASILFSFGRGLVFFAPGLVLWLDGRTRRAVPGRTLATLLLLFVAGLVLVYAKWWAWYGGLTWGPRFFIVAAVPASLLLAVRLRAAADDTAAGRTLTLAVLALSAWVGLAAALGDLHRLDVCAANGYQLEALCWYAPEFSGLWWPVLHYPGGARAVALTAWFAGVFAYLAAPLAAALARDLRAAGARLGHGWRL